MIKPSSSQSSRQLQGRVPSSLPAQNLKSVACQGYEVLKPGILLTQPPKLPQFKDSQDRTLLKRLQRGIKRTQLVTNIRIGCISILPPWAYAICLSQTLEFSMSLPAYVYVEDSPAYSNPV